MCAAGRFSTAGAPNISSCAPCVNGTFSAAPGTPCAPCPAGLVAPAPGATSCVAPAAPVVAAGAAGDGPAAGGGGGGGWAAAQAVIVPALSILGAIFTYLAVGDRLFAFCAPRLHARAWRGAASVVRSMTPTVTLVCCCCCRARAAAALDGIAVGVLKRLADMEEERRKMALAHKAFRAPATDTTTNPLYAAACSGAASPAADAAALGGAWTRHSDESDVWYSRGDEVVWELPEGATLVGGGGGDGAEVWTRHFDGEDTWYTCGDATVWELPEGARVQHQAS
jgi:hypothetical protein